MPTSITTAPGLMWSAPIRCGLPTATTTMSARRVCGATSRVSMWQSVTVAICSASSSAMGLPAISLAPTTTASAPASVDAGGFDQFDHGQRGAGGDEGVAVDDVPDVGGVDAFDIFHHVDFVLQPRVIQMRRQRQVHHDAGDGGIGIQPADFVFQFALGNFGRVCQQLIIDAHRPAGFALPLGVQLTGGRGPDEQGGQMHGLRPWLAVLARPQRLLFLFARPAALPSMICADMFQSIRVTHEMGEPLRARPEPLRARCFCDRSCLGWPVVLNLRSRIDRIKLSH